MDIHNNYYVISFLLQTPNNSLTSWMRIWCLAIINYLPTWEWCRHNDTKFVQAGEQKHKPTKQWPYVLVLCVLLLFLGIVLANIQVMQWALKPVENHCLVNERAIIASITHFSSSAKNTTFSGWRLTSWNFLMHYWSHKLKRSMMILIST